MAHIEDRRRDGRGWRVRYRGPDGQERSRSFTRRTDADDFAKTVAADLVRGDWIDPRGGRVTVGEWSGTWFATVAPTLKPSTVSSYVSLLESRIKPRFARVPLAKVKASDVQAWLGAMTADGLSASRVRKCAVLLRMMMDAAIRDGLIRSNPVSGARLPRVERREAPFFAPEVVDEIADAMATTEYRTLIRVLGLGGLRWGEAAALNREHVDFLRGRLIVSESLTEVGGQLVRTATKSYQVRQVPLSPTLAAELATHLEVLDGGSDAPVFRSPEGAHVRYRAFHGRVWTPTLKALALPHVGLHVLRHSAAARLIQAGACRRPCR